MLMYKAKMFEISTFTLWMVQAVFFVTCSGFGNSATDTAGEVEDIAQSCPRERIQLLATCQAEEYSCRGRCGRPLTKYEPSESDPGFHCSCDAMCQVYDDCCWDYFHRCDERHDETWQQLFNAKTVCWEGHALISSCHDNSDESDTEDLRESIVSEDGFDLHFVNRYVYDSCKDELPELQMMTQWLKAFKQADILPFIPDLQEYISTGTASGDILDHLYDEPPNSVTPRPCYEYTEIICGAGDGDCEYFETFKVANITSLCTLLNENIDVISSDSSLAVHPTDSPRDSSEDDVLPSNDASSSIDVPNDLNKCQTMPVPPTFRYRGNINFSLLMNLKGELGEPQITFKGSKNWIGLYCPEKLWKTLNVTCELERKCKRGRISFFTACRSPEFLSVSSESESSVEAVAQTRWMAQEILTRHVEIEMSYLSNQTYLTEFGESGFTQKFRVLNYSLEHTGTPGLDLAKDLIKSFRQNEMYALSSVNNVTLCLSTIYGEQVCDDVFIHGLLAIPGGIDRDTLTLMAVRSSGTLVQIISQIIQVILLLITFALNSLIST